MADKKMEAQISVEFEEATSRQSLNSGETINTLWGKVKRWLSDLKSVCFSGSYNDLSDRPTTATTDTDGLMSAEDKGKLDDADKTYALKSKYGDTTIDVGRKAGTTVGNHSTAEGYDTTASGNYSHAEGFMTTASGHMSHAEGASTTASGNYSHAEGFMTTASGDYSHAGGRYTKALHMNEVAYGKYNKSNDDTLFSIGDGTSDSARHNAFEITTTGGKLHDKDIATTDMSLPANGGNADTVGGKSASDFVLALTEAQTANTKILIPDNVDVVDWLIKNAKIGTLYYRTNYSSGQSNLPLETNNWVWFTSDGNRYFARVMVSDYSTRDFLLNRVNLFGGWKEISTTPIKSMEFGITTNENAYTDTGLPVATTKIISILCSTDSMIGHVWRTNGFSTWLASFYHTSNLTYPSINTPVTFTVYYIEI